MSDLARTGWIDAKCAGSYRVWLRFADGLEGEVDLADELWGSAFGSLKDEAACAAMRFDPELRTIVWPNYADFAPEFLRERLGNGFDSARFDLRPILVTGTSSLVATLVATNSADR
jgi:hypothetical protein